MKIIARVEETRLGRLRRALAEEHELAAALDWTHAQRLLRNGCADALVVDPLADGPAPAAVPHILALRSAYPDVPVVVYTALGPATYPALAQLGHEGFAELVLHGVDDAPPQLVQVLERQPGIALAEALLDRLRPALASLPATTFTALKCAIRAPSAFHGVPDLAAAAGISRRSIYRECARAALASPRELLAGARVLRAYALLTQGDRSIDDVTRAAGYSSAHHLSRAMRWACGLTPARARALLPAERFIDALASRLAAATPASSSAS